MYPKNAAQDSGSTYFYSKLKIAMRKIIRALLAGWGAKKLGGKTGCGCFGTIIVFIILWWLLSNLGI